MSSPTSQSIPDESSQPSSTPESVPNESISSPADNVTTANDNVSTKLRSEVWKHFERKTIDGAIKAVCKYCNDKLRGDSNSGTTHLKKHFTKKHIRNQESIRQKLLTSNFNKDHPELGSYSFSHDTAKKELAKAIIIHEYPLSIVDHVGFKRYSMSLQPLFKVPCRNTIKNEIFHIYEFEKVKILKLIENNESRVTITTDMWTTSNQKKGYMAVTAHFVDDLWTLQSRIMRFIYVPCPHTKEVLSDQLLECLTYWNMQTKISCLTVDNCSTNDAMIELIIQKLDSSSLLAGGSLFHMRCSAHILNLIVKDGLDVIKSGVEKIRDSVAYLIATPKREEKFEETVRLYKNTNTKKLGLNCATRWNSTFLMLETTLLYRDVFTKLVLRDTQYKCIPSIEEWEFAQEVCGRLKCFYKATEVFSGTKYPTANLCFINICEIRLALIEWRKSPVFFIQVMAEKILLKFEKYWHVMHGVVGVAVVLDPTYKMEVLEFYFDKIFGRERGEIEVENIRQLCYSLLKEYNQKLISGTEGIGESLSTSLCSTENTSQYDLFISTKKRRKVDYLKSELDHYLEEDVLPKTE